MDAILFLISVFPQCCANYHAYECERFCNRQHKAAIAHIEAIQNRLCDAERLYQIAPTWTVKQHLERCRLDVETFIAPAEVYREFWLAMTWVYWRPPKDCYWFTESSRAEWRTKAAEILNWHAVENYRVVPAVPLEAVPYEPR